MSQADSDRFLKSLLRENPQSFVNPWGDLQAWGKEKKRASSCVAKMQCRGNDKYGQKIKERWAGGVLQTAVCPNSFFSISPFAGFDAGKSGEEKVEKNIIIDWASSLSRVSRCATDQNFLLGGDAMECSTCGTNACVHKEDSERVRRSEQAAQQANLERLCLKNATVADWFC